AWRLPCNGSGPLSLNSLLRFRMDPLTSVPTRLPVLVPLPMAPGAPPAPGTCCPPGPSSLGTIVENTSRGGWDSCSDWPLQVLTSAVTSCAPAGEAAAAVTASVSAPMSILGVMGFPPLSVGCNSLDELQ